MIQVLFIKQSKINKSIVNRKTYNMPVIHLYKVSNIIIKNIPLIT